MIQVTEGVFSAILAFLGTKLYFLWRKIRLQLIVISFSDLRSGWVLKIAFNIALPFFA